MPKGDFLWCDLSTFNVENTKGFYAELFGWTFQAMTQPDGSPYHIGSTAGGECAAIFEMPQKFQAIGLPSFWMSYVAVDDIDTTVEQARALGGKVEVGPVAFGGNASIALIRDPLGAGFTVYQGGDLQPRRPDAAPGQMAWNALYVSDAQAVTPFYEAIFGWDIAKDPSQSGVYTIRNSRGDAISAIHELPDDVRGKHQFWGVHFAVADMAGAKTQLLKGGGTVLYEEPASDGGTLLARDPDGAAFFLVKAGHGRAEDGARDMGETRNVDDTGAFKWKTVLGLAVIWIAVVLEFNWVWGVLFIMWTIPAFRTGQTFFVEPLRRSENALLFWFVVGTWIVLSLYLILFDLGIAVGL